ncbi:MAG: hypothetical protein QM786_09870 [Breznakibacter sp.]
MGKITIYLSLKDGELDYRDSENHKGQTITTSVDPGDKIVWKLDQCSGIKEITNITINGPEDFFKEGPEQKDFDTWKAEVSKRATGEIEYSIEIECCESCVDTKSSSPSNIPNVREAAPPKIKVEI